MATIRIQRRYRQSSAELRQGLENFGVQFREKFDLEYQWIGQRVEFKRSGVKGFIEYDADTVSLEMKLGLMYAPFASKVRSQLEAYLDEHVTSE